MSDCHYNLDIIHFDVRDPDKTLAYVYLTFVRGDCPYFVVGWHCKEYPASVTTAEIYKEITNGKLPYLTWPQSGKPDIPE